MEEEDDLFSQPELIPENIQEIFDRYYEQYGEEMEYSDTERMQKEVEAEGYTFDFGLDNVPYNLRKTFAKGGGVGKKARKIARPKSKRDTAKDKTIKALHAGKRTTDWGTTYVENRVNRSDKNRTKKFAEGGSVGKYENYVDNIYSRQSEQDISDQLYSFAKENGYDFSDIEEIVEKQPFEEGAWGDRVYTKSAIRKMIREVAGMPEELKKGGEIKDTKQSSMTDKEKEKLTRISRLLDNNQVNDPELKAKLQAERDMLEEKAGTSTPAPKSKPAPKAKKAAAPKAAAPAPKAKKSGETLMEYAKRTKKEGEKWQDALKRASKEMKNGGKPVAKKIKKAARKAKPVAKKIKKSVTKKTVAKAAPKKIKKSAVKKKAAQKLPRVIKRVKHLNGSTSIAKDKKVRALASGKRMSKAGNIYYEYRANRADLNRTKKLKEGGEI